MSNSTPKTQTSPNQGNIDDDEISKLHQKLSAMDKNDLFELTLVQTGGFGYHQMILWTIGLLACFLAAFNHLGIIFIAFSPDFYCLTDNSSDSSKFNQSLWSQEDSVKCPVGCQKWSYSDSIFASTVVTEFDLVCDRLPLLPTLISSYMIGIIFTITFSGYLSDSYGRRRMAIIFSIVHIASSFATAFSTSYEMFVAFHVLVGGTIHSVWTCLFVLTTELMLESKRVMNGAVFNFGWNIGGIIMVGLAYLLRDWSNLQLSFAIPSLGLLVIYFLVPESPLWLLYTGQNEVAETNLRLIAQRNRVNLEKLHFDVYISHLIEAQQRSDKESKKKTTFLIHMRQSIVKGITLLKNSEFRKRISLMLVTWFAVGCCAYGIHFSVKLVNFDIFVMAAVKEVAIIITILTSVPIYQRMNSALCVMLFSVVSGLFGLSFLVIPADAITSRVVIFIFCQAFMAGNFYLIDTYTPELFSTDTRNFAFSFLDAVSKVGTTVAPFIVDLGGDSNPSLPPAIFGGIMITSSLVYFFTPNVRGKALIQTVEEMKDKKGETIFEAVQRKLCSNS